MTVFPKRKRNCERICKATPRKDEFISQNSKIHPGKSRTDLQRDLLVTGVNVASLTVRSTLIGAGRISKIPVKEQLLTPAMKKPILALAKKYNS